MDMIKWKIILLYPELRTKCKIRYLPNGTNQILRTELIKITNGSNQREKYSSERNKSTNGTNQRENHNYCIFPFNYFRLDARKPHVFVYFSPLFTSLSEIHYGNESFCIREPLIPIFHNLF